MTLRYDSALLTLLIVFFASINSSINVLAQKKCATTEFTQKQLEKNPALIEQKKIFEEKLQSYLTSKKNAKKKQQLVNTIPVVFHVLYKYSMQNVEVEKLQSQIEVLNQDYRRKNEDKTDLWPQAADTQIEFCLANVDIDGNYFEGVTRTETNLDFFDYEAYDMFFDDYGGKDIWPGYLNFYVCDLDLYTQGVLGFASLPGYDASVDGIVLDYRVTGLFGYLFPPYVAGRTATHEIGHWLNLEHTWGPTDDSGCILDDGVADTPESENPYFGCQKGTSCGSEDMVENFMDYHDDSCMNLFTQGQSDRMNASINLAPSRAFIKNHTKCESCNTQVNVSFLFDNMERMIQASNRVMANNSIINQSNITYFAGDSIVLNNGFNVNVGTTFLADIQACAN